MESGSVLSTRNSLLKCFATVLNLNFCEYISGKSVNGLGEVESSNH